MVFNLSHNKISPHPNSFPPKIFRANCLFANGYKWHVLQAYYIYVYFELFRRATTKKAAIINIPFAFETDNNTCGIRNILLQHKCSIHTTSKLLKHDALKSDDTVEGKEVGEHFR